MYTHFILTGMEIKTETGELIILALTTQSKLMTKIKKFAQDGICILRRLLRDHIAKLDVVITPSHRDLRIPKSRLGECPWPPAQRELKMLSAYKTPSDKLRCIIRACSVIVNLLSSSSEKVVAADDFVPVLVFVLIKVSCKL